MGRKSDKQEWDVRTNMSPNPGAQGTLFSGGKKYSSPERYPRGYTPDRLHGVLEAAGDVRVEHPYSYGTEAQRKAGDKHMQAPKAHYIDTLARSTVPTEDVAATSHSVAHDDMSLVQGNGAAGIHMNLQSGSQVITKAAHVGNRTPIHEIGHAVSSRDSTDHSRYSNDDQQGHEEAYADDYAITHYRDRRGNSDWSATGYQMNHMRSPSIRSEGFWDSYSAAKKLNLDVVPARYKFEANQRVTELDNNDRNRNPSHVEEYYHDPMIHEDLSLNEDASPT